jgi:hypothetical protein
MANDYVLDALDPLNLWRMEASGGNLKQLSNGKLDYSPVCSSDGKWAYYVDRSVPQS